MYFQGIYFHCSNKYSSKHFTFSTGYLPIVETEASVVSCPLKVVEEHAEAEGVAGQN